jgi:hypothetical protein
LHCGKICLDGAEPNKRARLENRQSVLSRRQPEVDMTPHRAAKSSKPVPKADVKKAAGAFPPAGPHARPDLTNYDACPGAGCLPSEQETLGGASDPGAG